MAPELLLEGHLDVKSSRQAQSGQSRQPRYNPRAVDVWALGVMLYLLVTGMYPFEVGQRKKVISQRLRRLSCRRMLCCMLACTLSLCMLHFVLHRICLLLPGSLMGADCCVILRSNAGNTQE
jgi:serine/threonine protein kinase